MQSGCADHLRSRYLHDREGGAARDGYPQMMTGILLQVAHKKLFRQLDLKTLSFENCETASLMFKGVDDNIKIIMLTSHVEREKVFDAAPKKEKIIPGMTIEFLGRNVTLQHNANVRGNCYTTEDKTVVCIGGGVDMFERRVRDFVKQELLSEIKIIINPL